MRPSRSATVIFALLIGFFPLILASNPKISDVILNGMKTIFSLSSFATHTDYYLTALNDKLQIFLHNPSCKSNEASLFKELYKTNCIALASTHEEALCKISKDLFNLIYIKRWAPSLERTDQIEIGFASILQFLPHHALLAIEALTMLENENNSFKTLTNKTPQGIEKHKICFQIISTLIDQNNIFLAKNQLLKYLEDNTLAHNLSETTDLWLSLLNKA